ncbi:hypothetical protein JW613_21755 [Streptomyces smyrnaeus]|uniref:Uncharacterized protein n=1 Tax=Streptomyces smyrnaeus TaxID=1387713 RepID=A0ABS3XZY9_9ACTN|nr:hypothetical protein [Streptomyces smyrnaeus]
MDGEDQPRPLSGGIGCTDLGVRPAQGLLEEPEGVFDVEAPQEDLPEPVDIFDGLWQDSSAQVMEGVSRPIVTVPAEEPVSCS